MADRAIFHMRSGEKIIAQKGDNVDDVYFYITLKKQLDNKFLEVPQDDKLLLIIVNSIEAIEIPTQVSTNTNMALT